MRNQSTFSLIHKEIFCSAMGYRKKNLNIDTTIQYVGGRKVQLINLFISGISDICIIVSIHRYNRYISIHLNLFLLTVK